MSRKHIVSQKKWRSGAANHKNACEFIYKVGDQSHLAYLLTKGEVEITSDES